jgi:hypothetical protein
MQRSTLCQNCGHKIVVEGQTDGSRERKQPVTCSCGELTEIMWPPNLGWRRLDFADESEGQ